MFDGVGERRGVANIVYVVCVVCEFEDGLCVKIIFFLNQFVDVVFWLRRRRMVTVFRVGRMMSRVLV